MAQHRSNCLIVMHQSIFEANLPEKSQSITRNANDFKTLKPCQNHVKESCHSPVYNLHPNWWLIDSRVWMGKNDSVIPVSIIFHDKFSILPILFSQIVWFDVGMSSNVAIAILLMATIPLCVSFFLQLHLLSHLLVIQSTHFYQLLIPLWISN